MRGVALAYPILGEIAKFVGAAVRTPDRTVWPAKLDHELSAMLKVPEVQDRVSDGGMLADGPSMDVLVGYVKYIAALSCIALPG
jgi:hypothetical protein